MEKKIAFIPPSFMRGMSIWPSGLRLPRSKFFEKKRCVVSSCVSSTMEEKWSLRARSAMSSPNETDVGILSRSADRIATANRRAARIRSPSENWLGEFTLFYEPAEQSLLPRGAIYFGDGFSKGNSLGAGFHAVLRVGTILNAAWF